LASSPAVFPWSNNLLGRPRHDFAAPTPFIAVEVTLLARYSHTLEFFFPPSFSPGSSLFAELEAVPIMSMSNEKRSKQMESKGTSASSSAHAKGDESKRTEK